jgi:hypothetical protein
MYSYAGPFGRLPVRASLDVDDVDVLDVPPTPN